MRAEKSMSSAYAALPPGDDELSSDEDALGGEGGGSAGEHALRGQPATASRRRAPRGPGARRAGFIVQQLLHNKRRSDSMRCTMKRSLPVPATEGPLDG
jgi:hypothetical protein